MSQRVTYAATHQDQATHSAKAVHCRLDEHANAQGPGTMTITVTPTRADKPVNMEIDQLRGWATFMDRAVVVSLVVTVLAITALGVTAWLSSRFSGAVRAYEHAAFDRYKAEMGKHA